MICGEGPARPRLEDLASRLGVGARTRWLGFVDDPLPQLAAADTAVLLSSSPGEGRPLSAIEAAAVGTPSSAPPARRRCGARRGRHRTARADGGAWGHRARGSRPLQRSHGRPSPRTLVGPHRGAVSQRDRRGLSHEPARDPGPRHRLRRRCRLAVRLWTNQHHLMSRLAEANRILFVESLGLRRPQLASSDLRRMAQRIDKTLAGLRAVENLHAISPPVIATTGLFRWFNRRSVRWTVARATERRARERSCGPTRRKRKRSSATCARL